MGRLIIDTFDSSILGRKRKVRVWLPDQWDREPNHQFPVIFASDAQMKFSERDQELPFGSWGLDAWIQRLANDDQVEPAVVVAVDNSPQRVKEYTPFTEEFLRYKAFMTEELVPWARGNWRIKTTAANTAHMGSSMGGLISFALAFAHPEIFGTALCLSPWFEVENFRLIHDNLRPLHDKVPVRVYLDSGIRDWRGLDDGLRGSLMARVELIRLGWKEGDDLDFMTDLFFPTDADLENSLVKPDKRELAKVNQHTEYHWNRRLERPLRFFLGK